MISYFFLGPIFLLAKKNTPLADPYVRSHAKQASMIIALTLIVFFAYFFLRQYIDFSFFWISIRAIILATLMAISSVALLRGAYRAYHGIVTDGSSDILWSDQFSRMKDVSSVYSVESEEDRVRILASILPWVGIYLYARYGNPLMERWRIIASFFTFLIIVAFLLTGTGSFLWFLITIIYILLFVVEWVYLFVYGRFVSWHILDALPRYADIEAHIIAFSRSFFDFFRVVFWKEKKSSYKEYLSEALSIEPYSGEIPKYFMPVFLPLWNIFSLPSLFIAEYRIYKHLIIQWLIITALLIFLLLFTWAQSSLWILLLLFPIVHIMTHASSDPSTRAPIIWLYIRIGKSLSKMGSDIIAMKKEEETLGFTYDMSTDASTAIPEKTI
jgi:hypothetical protein